MRGPRLKHSLQDVSSEELLSEAQHPLDSLKRVFFSMLRSKLFDDLDGGIGRRSLAWDLHLHYWVNPGLVYLEDGFISEKEIKALLLGDCGLGGSNMCSCRRP